MILGNNHYKIQQAVIKAAKNGLSFGAPTSIEVEMAEMINQLISSIEIVGMANSGTETTMSAIRLARGYTRRVILLNSKGVIMNMPIVY